MATETIQIAAFIPAPPARIYEAWLSSREHTRFTGSKAVIDPAVGGLFTAWDGYIQGRNRELTRERIVQSWRTTEFPDESPDSLLTVVLEAEDGGTQLTLVHSEIPEGQGSQYQQGWLDFYIEPLKKYFKPAPRTVRAVKVTKTAKKKALKAKPARKKAPKPARRVAAKGKKARRR